MSTETDSNREGVTMSDSENRQIFDWIEGMIGPHFSKQHDLKENHQKFSLIEFELGKDEHSEDDLLRSSLGEGMLIPLRIVYKVDDQVHTNHLLMRLPTYFFNFAQEINDNESSIMTVYTHENYFYSTVLNDIKDFIQSEGLVISLPVPDCCYVKHCPNYEMRKTPALIDNILEAKSLLILQDPKGQGFEELEVEDIDLHECIAVTQVAKLHAVTYVMQQKRGKQLNDIWENLLCVKDQQAMNDHIIEGSFEFFANGFDNKDKDNEDSQLYDKLVLNRQKIEKIVKETLYKTGPTVPNCLLHMMIGGPNLFFRKNMGQEKSNIFLNDDIQVFISSWSLCGIGNPILDIALFSCISLLPEVRQRTTDLFLEQYWQIFTSTASKFNLKPQFDYQYLCSEFEKFQIWCFLFMVAACKKHDDMKIEETRDILKTILQLVSKISVDET